MTAPSPSVMSTINFAMSAWLSIALPLFGEKATLIIVTPNGFSLDWELHSFRVFLFTRFFYYGIDKYRSTDLENFSVKVEQA